MVNHVRLDDRLEGASNFSSWKIRVLIILREMQLEEYIESNISMPKNEPKKVTKKRHNNKANENHNRFCKRSFFSIHI